MPGQWYLNYLDLYEEIVCKFEGRTTLPVKRKAKSKRLSNAVQLNAMLDLRKPNIVVTKERKIIVKIKKSLYQVGFGESGESGSKRKKRRTR